MPTAPLPPRAVRAHHLLYAFAFLYPWVLWPGGLAPRPALFHDGVLIQSTEVFLLLPKLLILLAFGLLGVLSLRRRWAWTGFTLLLAAHLALVILGALNARDEPTFVVLGPERRLDGILYHLGLALLGGYAYHVLRDTPQAVRGLLTALLATTALQSLLLLAQRLGLEPVGPLVRWLPFPYPAGTIGHPGMVAGLLLLPLALGPALYTHTPSRKRPWVLLGLALVALGLGVTGNRSALIGLLVGLLALNLRERQPRLLLLSGMLVGLVLVGKEALPNPQGFERAYTNPQTLKTRWIIWRLSLEAVAKTPFAPWIGGGPDALRLALLRAIPPEHLLEAHRLEYNWPEGTEVERVEVLHDPSQPLRTTMHRIHFKRYGGASGEAVDYPVSLDKAHNLILDRLVSYGLLSALVWIALYLHPVSRLLNRRGYGLPWALLALFVYYQAWFPVIQVEPLHVLLLAAAWAFAVKEVPCPSSSPA